MALHAKAFLPPKDDETIYIKCHTTKQAANTDDDDDDGDGSDLFTSMHTPNVL